jgi:hypothetical protein
MGQTVTALVLSIFMMAISPDASACAHLRADRHHGTRNSFILLRVLPGPVAGGPSPAPLLSSVEHARRNGAG